MSGNYVLRVLQDECSSVRTTEKGDRNDRLFRAALAVGSVLHLRSHEDDFIFAELVDAALIVGLAEDEAMDTVRSGLRAGQADPRDIRRAFRSQTDVHDFLDVLEAAVREAGWSGHEGKRELMVLRGLIQIAREVGRTTVSASVSRIMVTVGTKSNRVVLRALHDLVESPWLTLVDRGGPTRSARYKLLLPTSRSDTAPHPPGEPQCQYAMPAPLSHDAFRKRALDKAGWRIVDWLAVHPGWHRQSEVARGLGVSSSTVWRQVREERGTLVKLGVVERSIRRRGSIRLSPFVNGEYLLMIARNQRTEGVGREQQARLLAWYRAQGYLDEHNRWVNAATEESLPFSPEWLLRDPNEPVLTTTSAGTWAAEPTSDREASS